MTEEISKFKKALEQILEKLGITYDFNPDITQSLNQIFVRLESAQNYNPKLPESQPNNA